MTQASERDIFARTSMVGRTTAGIAEALAGSPDPGVVRRRWGMIQAINDDETLDINVGGITIPGLQHDANYTPSLDERVYIDVVGTDMLVTGTTAPSGLNPPPPYVPPDNMMLQRLGTITSINPANFTVSVRFDDNSLHTITHVSDYIPSLGDAVHVVQVGDTYLVIGAIARAFRRPVGDMEPSFLKSPKPNTLFMQGQALSRAVYAALWAWANTNALVIAGYFGTGDGSSTFTLPDMRGRVPIGVGTQGNITYNPGDTIGANERTLAIAQMPSHDHNVAVPTHAAHNHTLTGGSGTIGSAGSHGQHPPFQIPVAAGSGANDVWAGAGVSTGSHTHSVQVDVRAVEAAGGDHPVTESAVGGTTPVDVRQPSIAVNWMIWT